MLFLSKLEKKLQSLKLYSACQTEKKEGPEVLKAVAGAETFHFDRAMVMSSAASVHLEKIEIAKNNSGLLLIVHLPVGAKTFVTFCNIIHTTPKSS